ncbi:MAG: integrase arm-type DNA-binding domain-containing protein, partial [Acetobacteraceae bacterium]|nr:integrase arm-type DNA-binding domain-containing protein [Acetobacteraceae bacterium]
MKRSGNLDARTIDAAEKRASVYRLSDGGGLLLEVKPSGAKVWLCRVTVAGKRRDMGLGGYPAVSLKDARRKAEDARRAAQDGADPIHAREERRRAQEAARDAEEAARRKAEEHTFRAIALRYIAAEGRGWKTSKTAVMWTGSLERWAFPTLGKMPVAEIDRAAVLRAVEPVWTARPATGRKVLRRIGAVLRYAAAHGWRANDNPADARMLRHAGLPALPGGRKQPSLPWARLPAFMAALDKVQGFGALALRLAILTALRSGEVRAARWSWLSFDGVPTLTVPGEVMKGKRSADVMAHRVPLSDAALETLARAYGHATGKAVTVAELPRLAALAGDRLMFPSSTMRTPISDMTLSAVLRRMNDARAEGMPAPWRDADGREAVP